MNLYASRSLVGTAPAQSGRIEITSNDYRRAGLSFLGSVALCAAWKEHRVIGFLLGGMLAGAAFNVISPPAGAVY